MPNPSYQYESKQVDEITIRAFNFEFPDDLDPNWVPDNPARSHLFNGLSLTMPYLEPYLIKSNQAAMKALADIDEPRLLEDMRGFNGQEARHYQCHRKMNELLKSNGYAELAEVEEKMQASFERLAKRNLRTQLAYNAGFECMTNGFTTWLINKRRKLFLNASPHISSFWLMHMVEETEHKTVAYDVYMAYSGAFWPRFFGVFHGSFHLVGWGFVGMYVALKKDKKLWGAKHLWNITKEISSLIVNVGPFLLRALLPGHNPRCEEDPQWMKDWCAGHATLPKDALIPLLDTSDPEMPVPFSR
ncbi:MAG: metal-dependent hydrolase [Pseudomonadota bacterium]